MNEANTGRTRTAYTSPYKKRVNTYPNTGSKYAPVVGFDPTTARGSMDRIERASEINAAQEAGLPGFSFGSATPEERKTYKGTYLSEPGAGVLGDGKVDFDLTGGLGNYFGGTGGGGSSSADKLAWEKFRADNLLDTQKFGLEKERWASEQEQMQAEMLQAARERANKQRALGLLRGQLDDNRYRGNIDDLLSQIGVMGKNLEGDIGGIYDRALSDIGGGYKTASDLMGSGYNALDTYLNKYSSDPYAGLKASTQPVTGDMTDYLRAYGAPTADVQGQVQAEQLAGQQGTDAFNRLVSVLSAAQEQSNLSRLAESQMARNLGTTQLGSQRAMFESQASNAKAQALAQLKQRIAEQNLQQEAAAGERKQSIIDQLISSGVDPYSAFSITEEAGTQMGSGSSGTYAGTASGSDSSGFGVNNQTDAIVNNVSNTGAVKPINATTAGTIGREPVVSPTGIAGSNTAPAGYRYDKSGKLVANLGNEAPNYKPPTKEQKENKPDVPAGKDLHWEWSGKKWVPVPNKGAVLPTAAPAPTTTPKPTATTPKPTTTTPKPTATTPTTPAKDAAIAQAPAPAGFHYDAAGKLVANEGKNAPDYKPPTATQLDKKPDTPAGEGLHWEWNGKKWVPVPNKGVTAPAAPPVATPAAVVPTLSQILAQPAPVVVPTYEEILAELANLDLSKLDFSGIGSIF